MMRRPFPSASSGALLAAVLLLAPACSGTIDGRPPGAPDDTSGTPTNPSNRPPSSTTGPGMGNTPGAPMGMVTPGATDPTMPMSPGSTLPVAPVGGGAPICGSIGPRIWKLTPSQLSRTVAWLLPGQADITKELESSLGGVSAPVPNEAGRQQLSVPHVSSLFEISKRLSSSAMGGTAVDPCVSAPNAACARTVASKFGARAFRRPLSAAEVESFGKLFDDTAGTDAKAALALVFRAILMSPNFLFRTEMGPETSAPGAATSLTPWERASKLSYFITDGPPDAMLWAAAQAGELSMATAMETHARRLVASPASAVGLKRFFSQVFQHDRAGHVNKDPAAFPTFTAELGEAMSAETDRLIDEVLFKGDGRLESLLLADFTIVDSSLAKHYGLSFPAGAGRTAKVMLPADRRGLLMQGSLMTHLARDNDSDAVLRGLHVRQGLLCNRVPPPPSAVSAVPIPPDGKRTQRERLEFHRKDPSCAGCHNQIDPLGLPFEVVDGVGRSRTMDAGKPIDSTGRLVGTRGSDRDVKDPVDLARALVSAPELTECFAGRLAGFADSPELGEALACVPTGLLDGFSPQNGKVTDLVVKLVAHPSFVTRGK